MTTAIVKHDIDIENEVPPAARLQRYTPERHVEKKYWTRSPIWCSSGSCSRS
jgi:hypothetical protein